MVFSRPQASTLIGGLAGERTRWTEDSEKSADLKRRLVGDCALGSAFVSYCGPFNQEFRQYMVTDKFTVDLTVRATADVGVWVGWHVRMYTCPALRAGPRYLSICPSLGTCRGSHALQR